MNDRGSVNVLRYHPRPPGKNPVPDVVGVAVVGGVGACSMLQSCGTSTRRQEESSKDGSGASAYAPSLAFPLRETRANRQWRVPAVGSPRGRAAGGRGAQGR